MFASIEQWLLINPSFLDGVALATNQRWSIIVGYPTAAKRTHATQGIQSSPVDFHDFMGIPIRCRGSVGS